jgi:hypothetical protein
MKKENILLDKWLSVPLSLKLVFVIVILGLFASIYTFSLNQILGYSLFGFEFLGVKALLLSLVFDLIGSILILFVIWSSKKWGFWYGISYYSFLILNGVLAIYSFKRRMDEYGAESPISDVLKTLFFEFLIAGIFGIGIYILLLVLISRNRKYFRK